jgi:hypothetical protein
MNIKITKKTLRPMFAGYVFTKSYLEEKQFAAQADKYTRFSKCIYEAVCRIH